ncbi:MAG TPA: hypothetical protein VFG54_05150 [Prolixibacteraceae bacterium]|nr:hypothetical protein [Prolixibacteraceae bacterium]
MIIGDLVTIERGVQLWDDLRIGNNVIISSYVIFTNDTAPRPKQYSHKLSSTIIDKGASIGANTTIIGGLNIG